MVALPFGRLSNRALAASGGKCRCGPLGRGNYKIPDIRIGVGFYPARRLYFAFAFMPPAAIFLSTAKEIWKRTPPKTNGFWISLVRLRLRYKKVPHRIACTSLPAAAPVFRAAMRWFIGFAAACWHAVLQNTLRSSAYSLYFAAQRAAPAHTAAGGMCAI